MSNDRLLTPITTMSRPYAQGLVRDHSRQETDVPSAPIEWPTREEWMADAERHVRQACYPSERIPNEIEHYLSAAELAERDRLRVEIATATRPLLTAEINRLRAEFPDLPTRGRDRIRWLVALDDTDPERAELAAGIPHLEADRRTLTRYLRNGDTGPYGNPLAGSAITERADPVQLARLRELDELYRQRHAEAAETATREAVEREVARRRTDEAWQHQRQLWARIDHVRHGGHIISRYGANLP
jgi:hypothetical protein